ncbi:MAG TPA: peptidylprolyl isomerase [Pirellulales bacterium]|nr:peptidylprolyl isomerase [Pirellulales bacterium]
MARMEPKLNQPLKPRRRKPGGWLAGGLTVLAVFQAFAWTAAVSAGPPFLKIFGKKSDKPAKAASQQPSVKTPITAEPDKPLIMARVNGQDITRNDLGRECLSHFGEEVLETLVNKELIATHCKLKNIAVSQQEVQDEINRMAERFGLPKGQLLKMLKEERGISPAQYANEIVWPTVALRKLAADRLTVGEQELQEAWDMLYGPAVQARLIACKNPVEAEQVWKMAIERPEDFGDLAKQYSADVNSASANGFIQPIHKHQGDPKIEKIAFALKPDEISQIVQIGNQYVILKCEAHLKAQPVPRAKVDEVLTESIRDKKLRQASDDLFKELQARAHVENVLDDPVKQKKYPGVAALINGRQVTLLDLAEACIDRHGEEMLQGMINRLMLEQACKKRKVVVGEAEMQDEIARAAVAMGKTKDGDEPDIEAWLAQVKEEQGLSPELYRHDVVWPSAALKKLVGEDAEITQEDIEKSFDANYGERVRCRAIVFSNLRQAQKVWAEARDNVQPEDPEKFLASLNAFGELAEKYSVETGSRTMRGEVPPIQKYGGQPLLEKEAFALRKGEITGVIQVAVDRYVILFCEGRTTPVGVTLDDPVVRNAIFDDLREKKMRIAMTQVFAALEDNSQIDNYLAGTIKAAAKEKFTTMSGNDANRGLLDLNDSAPPPQSIKKARSSGASSTAKRPTGKIAR